MVVAALVLLISWITSTTALKLYVLLTAVCPSRDWGEMGVRWERDGLLILTFPARGREKGKMSARIPR